MPTKMKKAKGPNGSVSAVKDTIATNRSLDFAPADEFPPLPEGYQPTPTVERRRRLRLVPGDLVALGLRALKEVADKGDQVKVDLGEFAPEASIASYLVERIELVEAAIQRQNTLLDAYKEIEDIALSDALQLLEAAYEEQSHRAKKMPELSNKYPMLEAFFRARGEAIAEGIARAKREAPEVQPN